MKIELFGKGVYAILEAVQEKKVGSLYVADKHPEKQRLATVKVTGPDVTRVRAGDRVVVSAYSGIPLEMFGADIDGIPIEKDIHRVFKEDELLFRVIAE